MIRIHTACLLATIGLLAPGAARAQAEHGPAGADSAWTAANWVSAALESLDAARDAFVSAAFAGDTTGMADAARTRDAGLDVLDRSAGTPQILDDLAWPVRIAWLEAALREHRSDWVRILLEALQGRPPEAGSPSRGPAALVLGLAARHLMDLDPEDAQAYLDGDARVPLETVARNAFLAAEGEAFPLRDEAFYQLWNLAEGEGDTLEALAWADSLVAVTPRSPRSPEVRLTRARALLAADKPSEAEEEANLALPTQDTPELRWFLAACSRALGFPRQEAVRLEYLIANHSADPLALAAWRERLQLGAVDTTLALSQSRRIQLLDALLANTQAAALDSLTFMAADPSLPADVQDDARLHVCRALYKRKQYLDALPYLTFLVTGSASTPEVEEATLMLARIARNTGKLPEMEARYREVIDAGGSEAARATWELGRELESQADWSRAEGVYSEGIKSFPTSHRRRDMVFRRGFDRQRQGKLHAAAEDFRTAFSLSRTTTDKEQAAFWLSRTLREEGREGAARSAARAGMTQVDPAGAYGVLLRERFERVAPRQKEEPVPESLVQAVDSTKWPNPVAFHYERGLELARMGQTETARREWSRAAELGRTLPSLNQGLALMAAAYNIYPEGVQWARRAEDLLPTGHPLIPGFERLTYPPAYYGDVRRESARHGVDPFSVWALMRQESYYDATAVSRAGALGLMQIMPATLASMTAESGLTPVQVDALFVPRVNITFGTQFFADRMADFGHRLLPTLASYNAGESKCREWMNRAGGDAEEVFIECIGYPETYDYVQRILWLKWVYRDYYDGSDPS